jgi:hypothetical protein
MLLEPLLTYCIEERQGDRLLFALRLDGDSGLPLYPEADAAVQRLVGERIVEKRRARRWPGTISHEVDGIVLTIPLDRRLSADMVAAGPMLSDWKGWPPPSLPEDLCVYRQGESLPILVSVTHEEDAWILARDRPTRLSVEESELAPDELFIPPAPDFVARF